MDGQNSYTDDYQGYDHDEPTAQEMISLRRVSDKLPWSAFLVAIVELCERFTYYGLSGPFQNYISNEYKGGANPGALGKPSICCSKSINSLLPFSTQFFSSSQLFTASLSDFYRSWTARSYCLDELFSVLVLCNSNNWRHHRRSVPRKIQNNCSFCRLLSCRPCHSFRYVSSGQHRAWRSTSWIDYSHDCHWARYW
jgi:hypothetical protein